MKNNKKDNCIEIKITAKISDIKIAIAYYCIDYAFNRFGQHFVCTYLLSNLHVSMNYGCCNRKKTNRLVQFMIFTVVSTHIKFKF